MHLTHQSRGIRDKFAGCYENGTCRTVLEVSCIVYWPRGFIYGIVNDSVERWREINHYNVRRGHEILYIQYLPEESWGSGGSLVSGFPYSQQLNNK